MHVPQGESTEKSVQTRDKAMPPTLPVFPPIEDNIQQFAETQKLVNFSF